MCTDRSILYYSIEYNFFKHKSNTKNLKISYHSCKNQGVMSCLVINSHSWLVKSDKLILCKKSLRFLCNNQTWQLHPFTFKASHHTQWHHTKGNVTITLLHTCFFLQNLCTFRVNLLFQPLKAIAVKFFKSRLIYSFLETHLDQNPIN